MRKEQHLQWFDTVALGVAFLASLTLPLSAQAAPYLMGPDSVVTRSMFGLHLFYAPKNSTWPQFDFGSWRLWDSADTSWDDLQPERGTWKFETLDRAVQMAKRADVDLVLTLGQTPQWAAARPNERAVRGPGRAAEPSDVALWDDYVRVVTERYKGRIAHFELWNEPRFPEVHPFHGPSRGFFSGSADTMVDLGARAYRIIKTIDPAARVLSPAFDGEDRGIKKLELYLARGGKGTFDILSFHFYLLSTDLPEGMIEVVARLRKVLDQNGLTTVPIWNTEVGYLVRTSGRDVQPTDSVGFLSTVLDDTIVAGRMARLFILGWMTGVERTYWFAWDSGSMGMLTLDTPRKENAIARAYRNTMRLMVGNKVRKCGRSATRLWSCEVDAGERGAVMVVWREKGAQALPGELRVGVQRATLITGEELAVDGGAALEIGEVPVVLQLE